MKPAVKCSVTLVPQNIPQNVPQNLSQNVPWKVPQNVPQNLYLKTYLEMYLKTYLKICRYRVTCKILNVNCIKIHSIILSITCHG